MNCHQTIHKSGAFWKTSGLIFHVPRFTWNITPSYLENIVCCLLQAHGRIPPPPPPPPPPWKRPFKWCFDGGSLIWILSPSLSEKKKCCHGKTFWISVCSLQDEESLINKILSYLSTKAYDVGTQKNSLKERAVHLITQNTCLNRCIRK